MLVIILSHFITTKGFKNHKRLAGKLEWFCWLCGCVLQPLIAWEAMEQALAAEWEAGEEEVCADWQYRSLSAFPVFSKALLYLLPNSQKIPFWKLKEENEPDSTILCEMCPLNLILKTTLPKEPGVCAAHGGSGMFKGSGLNTETLMLNS